MQREIEKKYLLKDLADIQALVKSLKQFYPDLTHKGQKTIISYFYQKPNNKEQVLQVGRKLLKKEQLAELTKLVKQCDELMVKCRSIDNVKYFTVKGASSGEDVVHATNRMELEVELDKELETINKIIVSSGIKLVSKWSSVRDFYVLENKLKADIEFVAGYGHKAELELVINDGESSEEAVAVIDELANKLGLFYASDELMGRMYKYYNQHWEEYFNTDKVFSDAVWRKLGR